jgi:quercetin dioxygenase-like cupin family protein
VAHGFHAGREDGRPKEDVMKKVIAAAVFVLLTFAVWHSAPFAQAGEAPSIAFDITRADIDYVLKNAPPSPPDRQLRVVDMGKYNLGIGIIHRGPTNDKPGAPIPVIFHDYTPETYIILSGSGVLTTGGVIENKRVGQGVPNVMNGPSGNGTAGAGAYSRIVKEGDIIIIPNKVAHGWSQITDHVTYLSVRPDPDRVLPAGYVYPLLLKNLPMPAPSGSSQGGQGRGATPPPGR